VRGSRNAIALLITLMFVMIITVAIGFTMKQLNDANKVVSNEKFTYQSAIIVEDILNILKKSPELKSVSDNNSSAELCDFLSASAFIPFESNGLEIVLQITSARSKFNPRELNSTNITDYMAQYMGNYMIASDYVSILKDNISGIKEDNSYNSAIFDEHPYLFRDYIASSEHLRVINEYYTKEYNDNSLKKIDFENLFYFTPKRVTKIDINYATPEVFELIAGVDKDNALLLSAGCGIYASLEDLGLNDAQKERVEKFKTSFFEPFLNIDIEIIKGTSSSKIHFEYDIKNQKGSNFVYEI